MVWFWVVMFCVQVDCITDDRLGGPLSPYLRFDLVRYPLTQTCYLRNKSSEITHCAMFSNFTHDSLKKSSFPEDLECTKSPQNYKQFSGNLILNSFVSEDPPKAGYPEDTRIKCNTPSLAEPLRCNRAFLPSCRARMGYSSDKLRYLKKT